MNILDRIIDLLGNTDQKQLTDHLGLKKAAFTDWKSGKSNSYRKYLVEISEFFHVSLDYLVYGRENTNAISDDVKELLNYYNNLSDIDRGKLLGKAEALAELAAARAAQEAEKISKEKKKTAEKSKPIIVAPAADEAPEQDEERLIEIRHSVYKVSAGCGFELDEGDNWETIEISDTPEARRADYALTISGDSMEPVYYDGDIVLVKMQDTVEMGQIGIFILDGSGYIKKYCGDHLVSLNEDYDDIPLSDYEDVRCSGRVIGRV
ncbi:MAG: helix-turn-helix domain-containing protein [Oscillospiraceae bacterium]|nr:helix-turn-helix domain-containing protein [Oscillospiraceae bacterium]